ncbi:hypothetical protein WMF18_31685 [Sorangium sp. So ce315]|uniref:hypothetical protein n=1 Tax=Sorangium sp. So ce315 TaxID=3133299 RepID=UPI003F600F20
MTSSTSAAGVAVLLALAPGCAAGDEPPAQGIAELGTGEWQFEPSASASEPGRHRRAGTCPPPPRRSVCREAQCGGGQ